MFYYGFIEIGELYINETIVIKYLCGIWKDYFLSYTPGMTASSCKVTKLKIISKQNKTLWVYAAWDVNSYRSFTYTVLWWRKQGYEEDGKHPKRADIVWDGRPFPGRCSYIFFFPTYCVEFCPCAKACFLKSEPILTEAVPAPVNSVRPSFVPHSPLYVCIWLGIFPEEVGSWFSVGSHARIRGDCRSLVPPCSEDLYGAGKVQEKGGRSDVSEQELRRLSQRVGDSVSLCSLLIRCLFWSWERKTSSVTSIYSFHLGRRAEGERGYKLCVILGNFKKYI